MEGRGRCVVPKTELFPFAYPLSCTQDNLSSSSRAVVAALRNTQLELADIVQFSRVVQPTCVRFFSVRTWMKLLSMDVRFLLFHAETRKKSWPLLQTRRSRVLFMSFREHPIPNLTLHKSCR